MTQEHLPAAERHVAHENVQASERPLRLILSLLLFAIVGVPMWVVYGFASGGFSLFGNCGPQGFLGQDGQWVAGSASSVWAAAIIGGVLWTLGGLAVWRLQETAVVFYFLVIFYVIALIVLALVSGAIWGPRHCVIS
jgi:hypothetical protein